MSRVRLRRLSVAWCALGTFGVYMPWDYQQADKGLAIAAGVLLFAYGLLRLGNSLFGELRDIVFAKAMQRSIRYARHHWQYGNRAIFLLHLPIRVSAPN